MKEIERGIKETTKCKKCDNGDLNDTKTTNAMTGETTSTKIDLKIKLLEVQEKWINGEP